MSQLIRKMLATAEKRKELLGIYTNYQDSTKFAAGYILASDDQFVLLGHIDPKGNYDGYIVKKIESIYLVEQGGKYLQTIGKLFKSKEQRADWGIKRKKGKLDILLMLFNYAKENQLIISLELVDSGNEDVMGYIVDIEDNSIVCQTVDDYGGKGAIAYFDVRNITHVVCDSEEGHVVELISKLKPRN